jgi:hypothetical protein
LLKSGLRNNSGSKMLCCTPLQSDSNRMRHQYFC